MKSLRRVGATLVALAFAGSMAGCFGTAIEPDITAVKYKGGSIQGATFDKCYTSTTTDYVWNDTNLFFMTSQRTWRIANDDSADSKTPIEIGTKPDAQGNPG